MSRSEFDVVVIGSGPGGGATAWSLARQGVKVLVLESGPAFDPFRDYRLHLSEWELHGFPQAPEHKGRYSFGAMQPLESRWKSLRSWNHISGQRNTTAQRAGLAYLHVRGVGGTTLHYTGEAHRLNARGMKMATEYGVAADWPLEYRELDPYYGVAEGILGVSGADYDFRRPRSQHLPLPSHRPSYASQKIMSATEELGIKWQPNTLAVPSKAYDGRPPCNYCGNCNRGCPRTDKGSVDVTFMRKALATGNCTLRTETTVTRIVAGVNDRIKAIQCANRDGSLSEVETRVLVVACGAVETPRLLLMSASSAAPDGLANETGHVGRNFMETLSWFSSGLHPDPLGSFRGLPNDIVCWDYNDPDGIPGSTGGCRFYPGTAEQSLIGPVNYATRVVPGWGLTHKKAMRELFGRVITIGAIGECLPNAKSFVDLDQDTSDRFGLPVARINSFLDDGRLACISFMAGKSREILEAMQVTEIFEEKSTYDSFVSTHVFGTCRMGANPDDSVVNANCRAHRWRNLFVADASVFPSSGGGEGPSLTIMALAIRTGDQIRQRLVAREI